MGANIERVVGEKAGSYTVDEQNGSSAWGEGGSSLASLHFMSSNANTPGGIDVSDL